MTEKKPTRGSALFFLKILGKIVCYAIALISLILLAVSWFGPVLLERILTNTLEQAGIESPEVRVESITPWGLHLSGIRAQQGRLKVDFLSVHFSPAGLMHGRVDRIVISGLTWHIAFRDGAMDPGLPELDAGGPSSGPPSLPFDSLALDSSFIMIHYDKMSLSVPFSLLLEVSGGNVLTLDARCDPLGIPVIVNGQGDLASGEATLQGRVSGSAGEKKIIPENSVQNASLAGAVDLNARWRREPNCAPWGNLELTAGARGLLLNAFGLLARLNEGSLAVKCALDENLRFKALDGDLRLDGLAFQEYALENLNLTVREQGAVSALSAHLARPFQATVAVTGSHPSIPELLKRSGSFDGSFGWAVKGSVPDILISRYSGDALAGGGLPFQASGALALDIPEWPEWSVEARVEKSLVGPWTVLLTEQNLRLEDALARAQGRFQADGRGMTGSLDEGTILSVKKITRLDETTPAVIDGVELGSRKGRPLATVSVAPDGSMEIDAAAAFRKAVTARAQNMKFRAGSLGLEGRAFLDREGPPRWQARVDLGNGTLDAPELPARARRISLDLPVSSGMALPNKGRFSIGQVGYDRIDLPGPSGQIGIHDNRLLVEGVWNVLSLSPLSFKADLDMNGSAMTGRFDAGADWFDMPGRDDLNRLVPGLSDLDITGQARLKMHIDMDGALLTPDLEVFLRDMAITSRQKDLEVSGISGSVRVDRLAPVSTPGNQALTIDRVRLGAFEAVKGLLAFRLEDPDHLFLEKMKLNLPQGGAIALQSARFDLGGQRGNVEVLLENIDLVALLAHLTDGKIDGSGLVYGRIPVSYEAGKIRLDTGYVYAVPGTGHLGIRDDAWMKALMFYVNEAMAGHPYLSLVSERMEQALRDFQYSYLTIDLKKAGSETAARVELRGKGVQGDPPQEIGSLVLNVNDLEELINRVLGFKMTSGESIDRALEDLLDFQ